MDNNEPILDDKIIIHTEYIEALDQDVSFTEAGWVRELKLRAEIRREQQAYIDSLNEE